jgi:Trk K+ transport system NAD-binding subunit
MHSHVILTNYDAVTSTLIRKLDQFGYPYVLLVRDPETALKLHDDGVNVMVGDPDHPETYDRIRLGRAALVAATGTDVANTNTAFTIRELSKSVPILTTANTDTAVDILQLAGSTRVFKLGEMMGQALARRTSGGDAVAHVIGFDEPLSNLDAALRGQTRVEIAKLHRDLGATTIYVTHDQVEAMTLADRVVVLRDGIIEQVGAPLELYDRPANQFVAQFIGTPQMNVVSLNQLPPLVQQQAPADAVGGAIGLRPESVTVQSTGHTPVSGTVDLVEALGAETLIYVSTPTGAQFVARQNERTPLHAGATVSLDIDTSLAHWFDTTGRVVGRVNSSAMA